MKTAKEIQSFLQNEPLIKAQLSATAIQTLISSSVKGKALFFGIGLCTSKAPAIGVPFDILSFILIAERLRIFLEMERVIILIADTHAATNSFMTEEKVTKARERVTHILNRIIHNLQFSSFELLLHSTINSQQRFQKELKAIPHLDNQYQRLELADIRWLHKHKNVVLKLGWTIDSSPVPGGHDERFFDKQLQAMASIPIAFLYLKAGRTFDKHRQKASPYISVAGENRLLIDPKENIEGKFRMAQEAWGDEHFGGTTKHIAHIVRAFEKLFFHLLSMNLEEKINHIMIRITKENI